MNGRGFYEKILFMTREELIIAMMPFSRQIKDWCKIHPEFANGLKITNPSRFIAFQAVTTTQSPLAPEDEAIGFYVYDSKTETYKQDYIINVNSQNKEFILYTRLPNRKYTKYVRDINEFMDKYSGGKYYLGSHHFKLDELTGQLKDRALQAQNLAERINKFGLYDPTQKELDELEDKLKKLGTTY